MIEQTNRVVAPRKGGVFARLQKWRNNSDLLFVGERLKAKKTVINLQ